ncbi:hypothetical protein [Arcicella rigui]|uniref:Uncharacterized protein n=1 Tax=Arcicella rigui TaxID=797020 RepID=A0ABU5Q9L9_9BACT|nr:hypothetical protein [Arcicella rigui]MEA5139519.1 hypothetical protein [Arcicella rigui]
MSTQQFSDLNEVKKHLKDIVKYMESTVDLEIAARYIVPLCLIDYLSKLYDKSNSSGSDKYKNFINEIMAEVNPKYKTFRYTINYDTDEKNNLPTQMYHVLRCGFVHSFSLIPDNKAKGKGGRDRSIILGFKEDNNLNHLDNFSCEGVRDACLFILDDFISDLDKSIDILFEKVNNDENLKKHILKLVSDYPYIGAIN